MVLFRGLSPAGGLGVRGVLREDPAVPGDAAASDPAGERRPSARSAHRARRRATAPAPSSAPAAVGAHSSFEVRSSSSASNASSLPAGVQSTYAGPTVPSLNLWSFTMLTM